MNNIQKLRDKNGLILSQGDIIAVEGENNLEILERIGGSEKQLEFVKDHPNYFEVDLHESDIYDEIEIDWIGWEFPEYLRDKTDGIDLEEIEASRITRICMAHEIYNLLKPYE